MLRTFQYYFTKMEQIENYIKKKNEINEKYNKI